VLKISLQEILDGKHPTFQTNKLKNKLLFAKLKTNLCEECGIHEQYNGKPIVMHLDHIDGNSCNHVLKNLRMLCPNCHSQTSTYSGRNIKNKQRTTLAEKRAEKKRLSKVKYDMFVGSRLKDYNEIDKKFGWIQRLSEKWKISHTQVRRFIQKHVTMVDMV
jgi:hypothetical protein